MEKAEIALKTGAKIIKDEEIPHIVEPGEVGAILELEVRDEDGNLTNRRVMKSESFVRGFLDLLYLQMNYIGEAQRYRVRDTGNTLRNVNNSAYTLACDGGVGTTSMGIRVGIGNTAPTIDDYKLETPCSEGTGANQFQHGAVSFGPPAADAAVAQFTITRNFSNHSGAAINVQEIGLYSRCYTYNTSYYVMTIRDVIAGGILIPDGQTLTVNYRIQVAL